MSQNFEKSEIGQLFIIGISGSEINSESKKLIEEIKPSGICLFSRNIKSSDQTCQLINDLKSICGKDLILSVDQEGGLVDRLRRIVNPLLSVADLSKFAANDDIKNFAEISGKLLRSLGLNVNFAPVVDVSDATRDKYINGLNSRIFGRNKYEVTKFAEIYIESLQKTGCLATIKHFPGLGASELDSHDNLPIVNISQEEFEKIDLYPFRQLIKNKDLHAVMVGHAAYPQTIWQLKDENNNFIPSSLNYNIVTNLLRENLGFTGLVLSDDMEMGAIQKNYGIGQACVMAIKAGVDILLICNSVEAIREGYQRVSDAVLNGEISRKRLNESLERIANFKKLLSKSSFFDEGEFAKLSERISVLNAKT